MSTAAAIDDGQELRRDEQGRVIANDGYPVAGLAKITEAMAVGRLSRSKVYQLAASGELETRRFGRSLRITWASIRTAFLE